MSKVTAVLSTLHEPADHHSGTRTYRGSPIIRWTLNRLARSTLLNDVAVLCWEDQLDALHNIAEEADAHVLAKGPRVCVPEIEAITAARRWGDGWRGGLHGATEFDQGFYAPWLVEINGRLPSDIMLLINPSAALIDAGLLDDLIAKAIERDDLEMCFLPAAPGFAAATVRPGLIDRLAATRQHPGRILNYQPDHPIRDAIGMDSAVAVPTPIARTTRRFTMDSNRQVDLLAAGTISLNGSLMGSDAERILHTVERVAGEPPMPREITLELSTRRLCRPIDQPATHLAVDRPTMPLASIATMFAELRHVDDLRLTLAGVGDPLIDPPRLFDVIAAARAAGVEAINVETDLLTSDEAIIRQLVESRVDVVSINVPAMSPATYQTMMGVDGLGRVIENARTFLLHRQQLNLGVPLLVPVFTKTSLNLAEMEGWYDQWLRSVGSAVIRGPSDFAGQIPDVAVADMSPPKRGGCARLKARMTVLCDGTIVACEQDILTKKPMGKVGTDHLLDVWRLAFAELRAAQSKNPISGHPLCRSCKEWHRP